MVFIACFFVYISGDFKGLTFAEFLRFDKFELTRLNKRAVTFLFQSLRKINKVVFLKLSSLKI